MNDKNSRSIEAQAVVADLLDDLESSSKSIDAILMRAQRLARIIKDGEARAWLEYETKGYPKNFKFSDLGYCKKYALASGRIDIENSQYWPKSLPELEAELAADESAIQSRNFSPISLNAKDFVQKSATEALIATHLKLQAGHKQNFAQAKAKFVAIRSGIHSFASDVYIALTLGDIAQEIFDSTRTEIDNFVRLHCPDAAEKLISINARMAEDALESRAAALTSCRRLLMSVADSLFPAQEENWIASDGKPRKVGTEQYKNRLLAFISENIVSNGDIAILEADLGYLAARLDAIYEKTCKGVHVDVSVQEARLAVIHTYLFIGELALVKK